MFGFPYQINPQCGTFEKKNDGIQHMNFDILKSENPILWQSSPSHLIQTWTKYLMPS